MTDVFKISVIIPCLNEESNLRKLLPYLIKQGGEFLSQIIVSDGGSQDNSIAIAESFGVCIIHCPVRNRASQLNFGAQKATGDIFYFLHADTIPVADFARIILHQVSNARLAGCFRYRFDCDNRLLKINSWFTRFNSLLTGGGDQSLFIEKSFFQSLGGYDESFCIMEDFELVQRIRQKTDFHVLPSEMTVSARKYNENNWLKVQLANFTAFSLFLLKVKPATIKSLYLNLLNQKK